MKNFQKSSRMAQLCPNHSAIIKRTKSNLILGIDVVIAFLILSLFHKEAFPQSLAIGDRLPNLSVKVIHHPTGTINLAEAQKLTIIDFFATWCGPCIGSLPQTDSLQKVFKNDVVFLPVTYEPRAKVEKLLSKTKKLRAVTLPIATEDEELHKLFPHTSLPHYVWVNAEGIVTAITYAEEVNGGNIKKMLAGNGIQLAEKKDKIVSYDRNTPFLFGNLHGKEQTELESMVSGFVEGLPSRYDVLTNKDGILQRITCVNASLEMLYLLAWSNGTQFFGRNRIVYEVKNKLPLITEETNRNAIAKWMREYTRCYELIIPPSLATTAFMKMQDDLSKYFPQYKATLEKRKVSCLALVRTSTKDKIKTSGKPYKAEFNYFDATMTNCTLDLLVAQLTAKYLQELPTPIIDDTGYRGNVDMSLDTDMSNLESLRNALQVYDLDLVLKDFETDMVVVSDTNLN